MMDIERKESNDKKTNYIIVVLLEIGAIVVLVVLLYNLLFPKEYWQTRELDRQTLELDQNRAKWESQHITHYRVTVFIFGYSYENQTPETVEVKDNYIVDALGKNMKPVNDATPYTVPWLFSWAQLRILEKPYSIDITYDKVLGYPKDIEIDPYTEPCCQEYGAEVQDFKILQP